MAASTESRIALFADIETEEPVTGQMSDLVLMTLSVLLTVHTSIKLSLLERENCTSHPESLCQGYDDITL